MSLCGTSDFYHHFNHGFSVLKNKQHSIGTRMCSAWWNVMIRSRLVCVVGICVRMFGCECLPTVSILHLWFCWFGLVKEWNTSITTSQRSRAGIPSMPQSASREKWFKLLENCVTLKSVSCTSNLLARTCDFRKCIRFLLMLTSSPQGLLQNQSLSTILPEFTCVMNVRDQAR